MSIYHQILGVHENDSIDEIKARYRSLCKKYHPDLSKADTVNKIALINEAYNEIVKAKNNDDKPQKQNTSGEGVSVYKDQAYAFYRRGLTIYRELLQEDRIESYKMIHDIDKLGEYECKLLEAMYYMNIVYMQYSESPWVEDAIEIIKALNRNRKYVSNIREYYKRHSKDK